MYCAIFVAVSDQNLYSKFICPQNNSSASTSQETVLQWNCDYLHQLNAANGKNDILTGFVILSVGLPVHR